jgi:predicted O-methyltransferase YrrM
MSRFQAAVVGAKRRALGEAARWADRVSSDLQRRLMRTTLAADRAEHAHTIASWTSEAELRRLYKLARSCRPGAVALEIGSYLGASSCYLAAGLRRRSGRLYCVDTWANETMPDGPQDTYADFLRNTAPFSDVITPVRKRSDMLEPEDVSVPVDLLFIDGDHSYAAVSADFARTSDWVAEDGIIAFHDVGIPEHPGVDRVVGEALRSGCWGLEGMVDSLAWIRRRENH